MPETDQDDVSLQTTETRPHLLQKQRRQAAHMQRRMQRFESQGKFWFWSEPGWSRVPKRDRRNVKNEICEITNHPHTQTHPSELAWVLHLS